SGQGATGAAAVNNGWGLGDKGWLNTTLEWRYHDYSYAGIGDFRFQHPDGSVIPGLSFPNSNVTKAQNFPYENRVAGDPNYYLYNFLYNFGYDVNPDLEIYGFGNASYRLAAHYENYRSPSKVSGNECASAGCPFPATGPLNYPLPLGFDPLEQIKEIDGSFTFGVRGKLSDWNYDLAATYGDDYVGVYVIDSANAQLFPVLQSQQATPLIPQRNFYNGAFEGTQFVTSLDIDRGFDTGFMASPLNLAFGFEYRYETFAITAGEPSSYFGGGAQSFDGYTPLDQGKNTRSNFGAYIDVAGDPIQNLHFDLAGRYEHYSDFGDALVGKLTGRYDFNPQFAIRGTVSNGFRAPTLAEEFYSGTNVSPTSADVQLPPNSAAAQLAGFRPLQPEKSMNFSAGIVAHPMEHMQITLDGYDIQLKDRILPTGFIFGSFQGTTISQGVLNAITARGVTLDTGLSYTGISVFTNAANTRTVGVELTWDYASDFGEYGHVDWTVGFNYNSTTITSIKPLPSIVTSTNPVGIALGQGPGTPILSSVAATALTDATPPEKAILQALWNIDKFSVNARVTVYGATSETEILNSNQQQFVEQIPTTGIFDLDVGYKVNRHLRLDLGANNLFNTFPPRAPVIAGQPADNGLVFNVPYTFSPWGINGGYYYGRIAFDW
ncbi:MAG TPA: TonB-dependent receptor, partial [Caulobacteraceae bacterium]|nr:TonB-dependent receptor [Caulobacteraceae bacterium]